MELGERIEKISIQRKISFDGKSYHSRILLELIQALEKFGAKVESVLWDGIWKDFSSLHVVLTFSTEENVSHENQTESENSDDYVEIQLPHYKRRDR